MSRSRRLEVHNQNIFSFSNSVSIGCCCSKYSSLLFLKHTGCCNSFWNIYFRVFPFFQLQNQQEDKYFRASEDLSEWYILSLVFNGGNKILNLWLPILLISNRACAWLSLLGLLILLICKVWAIVYTSVAETVFNSKHAEYLSVTAWYGWDQTILLCQAKMWSILNTK